MNTINGAGIATLYRGKKVIGTCAATPNSVAYSFSVTPATSALSNIGEKWSKKDMKNRVISAGWLHSDDQAALVRA